MGWFAAHEDAEARRRAHRPAWAEVDDSDSDPARGLAWGMMLSLVAWLLIGLALLLFWL